MSGFKQCGYIEWDDDHHRLHSRLRDTILNQAVPIEAILEVNEMLLELEEASKDVENKFTKTQIMVTQTMRTRTRT